MDTVVYNSPIGRVYISGDAKCIARIRFGEGPRATNETALLALAIEQIDSYFSGALTAFDLPLIAPESPFQGAVRDAMVAIPFGETRSYGEVAESIGGVPRAVGQACGRNPVPIVVPCHRVLAANGAIGGFSGGDGRPTKRKLLAHEAGPIFAPLRGADD